MYILLDGHPGGRDHVLMKKSPLLFACLLAACQSPATPVAAPAPPASPTGAAPAPPPKAGQSAALLVQLRSLTADNACSSDSDCHTVAVGARACGGPEAYLAYSTAGGARTEAVQALAAELSRARAAELASRGAASTCNIVIDPGASCVARICQLRSGAADPR